MPIYNTVSSVFGSSLIGQLPAGTATLGSVTTLQGTNPWNIAGSVFSFGSGSVVAFQGGTQNTSITSTVPSSVLVGASIFGQLPAGTAMLGSVTAYQGAKPWDIAGSVAAVSTNLGSIITINTGSIITTNIGSVITIQQAPSIVGTYAEDAASGGGDKGIFSLGVRNDTMSSLVSADADYGGFAQDSGGRTIIKPFVSEDATIISYVGSVISGSVTLIQASVIGKKSYITDFIISNTGSTAALVTFQDGTTSLMGQFIAPAGGGMVATGLNIPLKPVATAGSDIAFKVSPSQSVLYLTVKGYQAQ